MKLNFGRIALIVSALLPVVFLVGALGVKFGLWPWTIGLFMTPLYLVASILVALVAVIVSLIRKPRQGVGAALGALAIPLLVVGGFVGLQQSRGAVPPIHDVTTNIADAPRFTPATMAARQAFGANPVGEMTAKLGSTPAYANNAALKDKTLGEVGAAAYPALKPLNAAANPAATYAAALAEAQAQGWKVTTQDPAAGVVEAVAETALFGFKDDVTIRVRPSGAGSIVDVRSTSRVGLSDMGTNAKRITGYLAALDAKLP